MDVFESSSTSFRHNEEEDHCVEHRQAAKKKIWSAVGVCEENGDDQNDQKVGPLKARQHLALTRNPYLLTKLVH